MNDGVIVLNDYSFSQSMPHRFSVHALIPLRTKPHPACSSFSPFTIAATLVPTYLITGAGGFIGSSLSHALVSRGETVRGIDNFITGRRENLKGLEGKLDLRDASILDERALADACKGVDYILHQAALPSVPRSVADPAETNLHNVTGTMNVLVAARAAGVKRVVFAASSSANGDTPTLPKQE